MTKLNSKNWKKRRKQSLVGLTPGFLKKIWNKFATKMQVLKRQRHQPVQ
jgi:hypothetical protein